MIKMINLPEVTLVCIDNLHIESSIKAINKSREQINFGNCLFLNIDTIKSKADYSIFIFDQLANYIKTEFCLIIQYDGYVLHPELWNPEFLKYDYIGAPWWYSDKYNVGNGGFSLRSRKLLKAISSRQWTVKHPEDECICRTYRQNLERYYDIHFAPEALAATFSYEPHHPFEKYSFNDNTFGFHGIPDLILEQINPL
jgi:hypothetical protein